MSIWQFYAVFFVMCVVGVALCYAMFLLSERCPLLGHKTAPWAMRMRNNLTTGFLIVAGAVSYFSLPDIVNAFTSDVTEKVVNTSFDMGEKVLKGKDISQDYNIGNETRKMLSGAIWGEYNSSQKQSLWLMTSFWFFLAWMIYVGNYHKSPSNWWQKACKIIAYPALSLVIVFFPINVHYFNMSELKVPLILLVVAGALIALSHDRTPLPPALPSSKLPQELE